MLARTFILALAAGLLASACSKTDPPPPVKPPTPKTAAPASAPAPVAVPKSGEIDDGLKERLARQEAAAKMFESKVLQPPAPKVPEPPPPAVKAAAQPAPSAAPTPGPVPAPPAEPAKAEPPKVAARVEPPKAAPAAPPQPAAASPAAPAPRTDLAAARPAVPAPEPQAATRLVTRVDPDFPREAAAAGVEQGMVKARMTLDAAGSVTRVEVIEANPRRVFDRAVVRALSQWRYSEGAAGRTVDMEVAFRSK